MRREDTSNVGSLDPGPYSFWVKLEWAGFGPEVGAHVSSTNGCNGSTIVTVDGAWSPNRYIQRA